MLALLSMMEIQFATALERARRAIALAEQIGHPRAAMIGYHGLNFVHTELGDFQPALEAGVTGTRIARALGARRFVGEGLILQAISEYFLGLASARETIREAVEVSREWPAYILPYGLAAAAMITRDPAERAAALAEGEATIAAGAVSHNVIFFNRMAIEACLTARDWAGVERYAAALAEGMAEEPTPVTEFVVARARALAAAGRGRKDEAELKRLIAQASAVNWRLVLPALEEALASA
jgi:hypothetical protein